MDIKKSLSIKNIYKSPSKFIPFFILYTLISFVVPILAFAGLLIIATLFFGRFKIFSFIESLILGILGILTANIIFYSIISLLHITIAPHYVLPIELLIAFLLVITNLLRSKVPALTWRKPDKSDIAALLIAVVTFFILLLPIAWKGGAYIAQFLSYGEDNASHYAVTRHIYHNGDNAYLHNPEQIGLLQSLEFYPQGFHSNAAIFESMFYPYQPSEAAFVKIYAFFITAMYAIFIFWFIKLCTLYTKKISWPIFITLLPALTLLVGLSNFLLLLDRGFQPHIFSYIFLLAITYVVFLFNQQKKPPLSSVYLAIFLCIGIASSWWLLLPWVGLLLLWYTHKNNLLKSLFRDWRNNLFAKSIVLFSILLPIVANFLFSVKHDPLSEPGGVDNLPITIFVYLLVPVAIGLLLRVTSLKKVRFIVLALAISLLMTATIAAYHMVQVGHLEYYFFKSLYTILIFSMVLFFIVIFFAADKLFKYLPSRSGWIVPIFILLATIAVSNWTNLVYVKVYTHNWFPNAVEFADTDHLFNADTDSYQDIVYIGDCNYASDYLSNRWAGARLLSETHTRQEIEKATILQKDKNINHSLKKHAKKAQDLLLIVDTRCASRFPAISELKQNDNITIRYTHTDNSQVE